MRTDILEEHAGEAMFLFEHRRRALVSLTVEGDFLAGIDERLVAHLDGLVVAGDAGWEIAEALFGAEEPAGPFVGAAVALLAGESRRLDALEGALIAAEPPAVETISAALRLFPATFVAGERATVWLTRPEGRLRAGALTALVGAGRSSPAFTTVLADRAADPILLRAALQGAMRSRDRSLAPVVAALEEHGDTTVRAAALEATLLLAGAHPARERARRQLSVAEDRVVAARALGLAGEGPDAVALARALPDATPPAVRALLLALGALGSGDAVEALLVHAAGEDAKARVASFSLQRVLGPAVEWRPRVPSPAPSADADDSDGAAKWTADDDLPLWSLEPVAAAWRQMSARLAAGARVRHGASFVARAPSKRTPLGLRQDEELEVALTDPAAPLPIADALASPPSFSWRAPAPAAQPRSRRA